MAGYYKNQEATEKVIDKDGWLHTGDMGTVNNDDTIFIKGRWGRAGKISIRRRSSRN